VELKLVIQVAVKLTAMEQCPDSQPDGGYRFGEHESPSRTGSHGERFLSPWAFPRQAASADLFCRSVGFSLACDSGACEAAARHQGPPAKIENLKSKIRKAHDELKGKFIVATALLTTDR
jgi:hypothetical protein